MIRGYYKIKTKNERALKKYISADKNKKCNDERYGADNNCKCKCNRDINRKR